ncbi:MAG: DUF971 domain-containing protein [Chloroflexi bacterium]|nr:DUF971 domain-containing protein [Chloroflexota bacterium]
MRPVDIQLIGEELALKWDDGSETYLRLETLRRHCPCAGCKGEVDIMGNLYKGPESTLSAKAFQLVRLANVGGYALQPVWADGHDTGLYSYDYLRRLAEAASGSRE